MKSSLSSKLLSRLLAKPRYPQIAGLAVFVISLVWGFTGHAYSPGEIYREFKNSFSELETTKSPQSRVNTVPVDGTSPAAPSFSHTSVITTVFWVGETANSSNGGISNKASAWDGQWQQHFGGIDDPKQRNGYLPVGFTPKENSFYFALPYSDVASDGKRKPSATNCPLHAAMQDKPYSRCKNAWIAIRHDGKIAYAQWEDVGPFGEDDTAYVFGNSAPANIKADKAGLDVSPAVRDYLALDDVDISDWEFVSADNIPAGPWKQTITTTLGDPISN